MGGGNRMLAQYTTDPNFETEVKANLDMLFLLFSGYLVFFMQCGFALLEAGTVRQKNVKNILLKNVIDVCIGVMVWWAVGYAFAYGQCGDSGFIGYANFFSVDSKFDTPVGPNATYWANWFFTWAFSATATTIVSGAVAERLQFRAYLIYTGFMTCIVYPVIAHWVWSYSGWLSGKRVADCSTLYAGAPVYSPTISTGNGVMDFAGSGVVHMTGGAACLAGAILLGPRLGRFTDDGYTIDFAPSSPANQILGVLILWFTWYGFNPGSVGCFYGCMYTASKVAVNTTLAGGAAGLTTLFASVFIGSPGDIGPLLNGILAGLVSITAPCAFVLPYAAVVIGIVGGVVYLASSALLRKLRIDDPLDAAPVHYFAGLWGLLSVGFFATETSTRTVFGYANDWGVFYGGKGYQLGIQILGITMITLWSFGLMALCFLVLKLVGWLRVSREDEETGLDVAQSIGRGVALFNLKAAAM